MTWRRPSRSASGWSTGASTGTRSRSASGRSWRRMFDDFWGNEHVTRAIGQMIAQQRIPQTLLFSGPEGVGKATLARRIGGKLLGHPELVEQDDLSLPHNLEA